MMRRRTFLSLGAGALAAPALARTSWAAADAWPNGPVQITVPFPPGSASDILSRAMGAHMSEAIRQPVIIDNRPGAGGTIGTDVVAKAKPDGQTLLMATAAHTITAVTYRKLPFDAKKDFSPAILLTTMPLLLVVHPSVKANSVKELVALAKAEPGKISFASSGVGTSHQMASELLKVMAGVDIVHVPYRGSAPAQLDLTAGRVDMMFDNIVASINQVRAGKLKPLAVSSKERSKALPDVPTMGESGYPDFDVSAWFGLMAPAGTPDAVIQKVAAVSADAVKSPDVTKLFVGDGAVVAAKPAADFQAMLDADYERWDAVARERNIQVD
ncbi:tripartite tricarboxylate transporter substrate binding protein [Hansschlegelia zhihuaiae]|nr:tripartite tricarboxylate transporter substrate binding protein [Hansschlegelia zhihuaiae]